MTAGTRVLRADATGGLLLAVAAVAALVWANVGSGAGYEHVRDLAFGPSALRLHLSIGEWTADGLLAVFFFTVGLELKQEFVTGSLRDPRRALVPVVAAAGGVAVPAGIFTIITALADSSALRGWAIPTATDIAFAVSVLAIAGRHAPPALRTFLLTLAVVDDLIAIAIIAVVYTDGLSIGFVLAALGALALFAATVRLRPSAWWALVPLALVTWACVHASGISATVAGVLLGLCVPARDVAARFEHWWRPWSQAVAVPVFALFAAGVPVGGASGLGSALTRPVTLAVLVALVVGKPIGIAASTWLATRLTSASLDPTLRPRDVGTVGVLGGIGFTVSLLVGGLAYGSGRRDHDATIGVLAASIVAALLGALLLRLRRSGQG